MHKLVRGAIAGSIATIPMTLVMTILFRKLPPRQQYPLPPRLITDEMAERTGVRPIFRESTLTRVALISHFGYGAATGAVFPYLERRRYCPMLVGPGYGLAVWTASYLGWIPALRILSSAVHHARERNKLMLIAHVVWGAALASISQLLSQGSSSTLTQRSASHSSRSSSS